MEKDGVRVLSKDGGGIDTIHVGRRGWQRRRVAGLVVPAVSNSKTETCALHSLYEAMSKATYLRLGQQRK